MGIAGIAVTVLSVVWPVAAAQEKHGPIGCWKGDEADSPPGNVTADATGAHPGVYRNGASTGPRPAPAPAFPFANERCMTFAGPEAGVFVPDAPDLRLTGDFTISFWVRVAEPPADWVRLAGKGNFDIRQFGIWLERGTHRLLFQQYDGGGQPILNLYSSAPIALNAWHHVAGVVEGQTARLYVGGSLSASGPRPGTAGLTADPLTFGYAGFHAALRGQMDEIRLYARALGGDDVASLARGGTEADVAAVAERRARKAEEALERFRKMVRDPAPAVRAAAVGELAGYPDEKTLKKVAEILLGGDPSPAVRAAAARALGNFREFRKTAVPVLQGALGGPNQKEYDVQAAVLEGLGKLGDEAALPTIHHHFRAEHVKVAQAALAAAGAMRHAGSIEPLIELGEDVEKWLQREQAGPYRDDRGVGDREAAKARLGEVRAEILRALQAITREKWTTFREWRIWWSRRKAGFRVPD